MTIFQKIIAGEIPSFRIYEDGHVLAFLDINPIARGHTLVVPKEAAVTLGELSDGAAAALGRVLPRICRAVQRGTECAGYNLLQNNGAVAGQVVMHAHIHIIPRYNAEGIGAGLGLVWRPMKLDSEQGELLAGKIAAAIA